MNNTRAGLLIGAVLVAAAVVGLWMNDGEPKRAPTSPDVAAMPLPTSLGEGAMPVGEGPLPPGHPPVGGPADPHGGMDLPAGHPAIDAQDSRGPAKSAHAEKLEDGVDVAEIYARAADLSGKRVRLRAQVVKALPNILGKTWLHVQDGSGDSAAGTHDLVVTTQKTPAVGDTVVLEGTVGTDRDLGSGYKYDVLLEDAVID